MSPYARRRPGIEVVTLDAPGGGANDAWWGSARVLVKPSTAQHPWLALNEFVGAQLAQALGLPVPMGDALLMPDMGDGLVPRVAWASAEVALRGQQLPPPDLSVVLAAEAELVAGMVVFDIWINNIDRHDENLIYHPLLGLWLIDHDQALVGQSPDLARALVGARDDVTPCRLFSPDELHRAAIVDWVARVQGAPWVIAAVGRQAVARGLIDQAEATALIEFLSYRAASLGDLVAKTLRWEAPLEQGGPIEGKGGDT